MASLRLHGMEVKNARGLLNDARNLLKAPMASILTDFFGVQFDAAEIDHTFFTRPKQPDHGDVAVTFFPALKKLKPIAAQFKADKGFDITPINVASKMSELLLEKNNQGQLPGFSINGKNIIKSAAAAGPYLNIMFSQAFHGQLVLDIAVGSFLEPNREEKKDKVMIEYSQPNTHKAFHVGHMRNAALGDCLTRLYEQVGHPVVPVNYFGDEGAHVAKCLWYLQKHYMPKAIDAKKNGLTYDPNDKKSVYPIGSLEELDTAIPTEARAEWLGDLYSKSVDVLDIRNYTTLPYPQVIAAKVLSKEKHPAPDAPANWHVVTLQIGEDTKTEDGTIVPNTATVVCGGAGYEVGDMVAYLPVGKKLSKKMGVVVEKDMKGVTSCGVMLADAELAAVKDDEDDNGPAQQEEKKDEPKKEKGGKKGADKKDGAASPATPAITPQNQIKLLPPTATPGTVLAEIGRKPTFTKDCSVMDEVNRLNKEAGDQLLALEHGVEDQVALWKKTGKWSLDAFKEIYAWLDCRFDHDFTESEVSEPSRKLVLKWLEEGKLTKSNGAVVMDLTAYNLGKCTLLKSNGAGLYATKDLALAARKFDQFNVDKSIYVVDSAQTYHFQQVFKTLELCGYEQAKKCLHLPYGIVMLPSGRMSSRNGTIIVFSSLRKEITQTIGEKIDIDINWAKPHQLEMIRRVSVAAIKYGMLNHDLSKDIVFEMDKWTNVQGNTGPYLMYAYTRIMSMFTYRDSDTNKFDIVKALKEMGVSEEALTMYGKPTVTSPAPVLDFTSLLKSEEGKAILSKVDFDTYLTHETERNLLLHMHRFWEVIEHAVSTSNPSSLCDFAYRLSQLFSAWYENVRLTAVPQEAIPTKIVFVYSIALMLKRTLYCLGITVVEKM